MLTIAAALAARAWVSTWPSRGSSAPGSSAPSSMIWAGTRRAVLLRRWVTPFCCSIARRSAPASGPRALKYRRATKYRKFSHEPSLSPSRNAVSSCRRMSSSLSCSTNSISSGSSSWAMPVTMLTRLWEFELTKYRGRSVSPVPGELGADRRPPAPGQPRVAGVRAAEHPHPQRQPPLGDQPHPFAERLAPRLAQAGPVVGAAAELARALLGRDVRGARRVRPARAAHANADLVPLDLERDERRHQVVDVRGAGQQHCERAGTAVIPAAPAGGGFGLLPGLDRDAAGGQRLDVLAHDDELGAGDPVREPADRVQERPEVELLARGERVQARSHRHVRGLEHPQRGLTARAEQRRVRAHVQLDLVAEADLTVGEAGQG